MSPRLLTACFRSRSRQGSMRATVASFLAPVGDTRLHGVIGRAGGLGVAAAPEREEGGRLLLTDLFGDAECEANMGLCALLVALAGLKRLNHLAALAKDARRLVGRRVGVCSGSGVGGALFTRIARNDCRGLLVGACRRRELRRQLWGCACNAI
eukprot:6193001-Pleurochrysis_carterae.AAC.7